MATVTVQHPDKGTLEVSPEVASALTSGSYGPWTRDGADQARIAELEAELAALKGEDDPASNGQDGMPDKAEDVIAWIGDDIDRAQSAGAAEAARDKPRKTVTDHIESVLNPTPNDPASNGQDGMPDKAEDVIAWIGDDIDRAQSAGAAEAARDKPRKTVTDHIESVLNPTPNDPASNGQED